MINSGRKRARMPIGVFDSGFGGLTVMREIMRILPGEDVIYFGDTGHLPYGSKSKETVTRLSFRIADFLKEKGVKIIVVACSTASSFALPALKRKTDVPVIGVIEPVAQSALRATENFRIGVIGTEGTIRSRAIERAIVKMDGRVRVFSQACPLFVPLVEEGWVNQPETFQIARRYLLPLKNQKVDTLVLGCTHYPLLKKVLRKVMGNRVFLIDTAEATAQVVKAVLEKEKLVRQGKHKPVYKFFVTDSPEKFTRLGTKFLGKKVDKAEKIELEG